MGQVTQNWKVCHHLLTLMYVVKRCMTLDTEFETTWGWVNDVRFFSFGWLGMLVMQASDLIYAYSHFSFFIQYNFKFWSLKC